MHTLQTVEETSVIDHSVVSQLLARKRKGISAFSRLLPIFQEEWPELLDEIIEAVNQKEFTTIRSSAHKLKGSASVLGAARVKNLCAKIIEAAIDNRVPEPDQVDNLRTELEVFQEKANELSKSDH